MMITLTQRIALDFNRFVHSIVSTLISSVSAMSVCCVILFSTRICKRDPPHFALCTDKQQTVLSKSRQLLYFGYNISNASQNSHKCNLTFFLFPLMRQYTHITGHKKKLGNANAPVQYCTDQTKLFEFICLSYLLWQGGECLLLTWKTSFLLHQKVTQTQ